MSKLRPLQELFSNNVQWAKRMLAEDPLFFTRLSSQQQPEYLWIGCSDSRVPANQIVGLYPGEIFVHRNIANQVIHTDLNSLSVIEYAVKVLKVKHIIVTGHYGCGGVLAAMQNQKIGAIDNWLLHIRDIYHKHAPNLESLPVDERLNKLCELNVVEQVHNVCHSPVIQKAWQQGQELAVHGLIYNIQNGILQDLISCITSSAEAKDFTYNLFQGPNNGDLSFGRANGEKPGEKGIDGKKISLS